MNPLASLLADGPLASRVFDERQLGERIGGGPARRYALVNRALKDGSLVRLKRGHYLLGRRYRREDIHPFGIAQALIPGSYVSFETALAYHGWIPEAVYSTASVTPGRKSLDQDTPAGRFTFHPLAVNDYQFLMAIDRQTFGSLTGFVATPLRALLDLVALRKERWTGLEWLTQGLRIDADHLGALTRRDFARVASVHKHKAVGEFLSALESACNSLPAASRKRTS